MPDKADPNTPRRRPPECVWVVQYVLMDVATSVLTAGVRVDAPDKGREQLSPDQVPAFVAQESDHRPPRVMAHVASKSMITKAKEE